MGWFLPPPHLYTVEALNVDTLKIKTPLVIRTLHSVPMQLSKHVLLKSGQFLYQDTCYRSQKYLHFEVPDDKLVEFKSSSTANVWGTSSVLGDGAGWRVHIHVSWWWNLEQKRYIHNDCQVVMSQWWPNKMVLKVTSIISAFINESVQCHWSYEDLEVLQRPKTYKKMKQCRKIFWKIFCWLHWPNAHSACVLHCLVTLIRL